HRQTAATNPNWRETPRNRGFERDANSSTTPSGKSTRPRHARCLPVATLQSPDAPDDRPVMDVTLPALGSEQRPMRLVWRANAVLGPYRMHLLLLAYTPALLYADGRLHGHRAQIVLGLVAFGVLSVCAKRAPAERRLELWACVPVATVFEIFGSLIWGGY